MVSSPTPKATFALRPEFDVVEDMDTWKALLQSNLDTWKTPNVKCLLAQKNYTLEHMEEERTDDSKCPLLYLSNPLPQPTVENTQDIDPYPFVYLSPSARNFKIPNMRGSTAATVPGRDAQGRSIVVKAFDSKGEEGAIYRHLHNERQSVLRENCMLPILDIIDFDDKVSFAVMPMWDSEVSGQYSRFIGDVSVFIHSLLKGMAYMHRNRIVHRDIRPSNYALNYHGFWVNDPGLLQLRKARKVHVACFDFDLAKVYPPGTDLASPRLPWWCSVTNECGPTPEIEQGELEYNPFALEVARLGYHFLTYYRYTILDVPTLVPLISMMIDWDVSRRFTAEDALAFYEKHCIPRVNELWDKERQKFENDPTELLTDEEFYDPWCMASPFFKKQWPDHQPRPMPLLRRLLRKICKWDYGLWMIRGLRTFWSRFPRIGPFKGLLCEFTSRSLL